MLMASCSLAGASTAEVPSRPDIILIVADDLGFSDLSCQGGEIPTPNIDSLAAQGVRFTKASNAARCCPSRASLLTGAYPHRVGMGWMTAADLGRPAYRGDLAADCATLPELLKNAGYHSFLSGKWHLAAETGSQSPGPNWPTRRGFDGFFGILGGESSYDAPKALFRDETRVLPGPDFYLTDAITDAALEFYHKPVDGPRFLYVAYTAPHWPLHAREEEVARHLPAYRSGYEGVREGRLSRMRELGLLTPDQQEAPDSLPEWKSLTPELQADQSRRMAVYAAQVEAMDRGVGRILQAVAGSDRAGNTLVIFASDNGSSAEVMEAPPLPANLSDAGRSSYGPAWASISSLPFRGAKMDPLQGGVATPLFVRWPSKAAAGTSIADPVHLIDILPTCAEAAGVVIPRERDGQALIVPDGVSLLPTLAGRPLPPRHLFFEHEGGCAVRFGDLKAVAMPGRTDWQLYDLERDPAELNDLAATRPADLHSLQSAWEEWADKNGVLPLDSRTWDQRIQQAGTGADR